jgi:pseudouridine-5'-phosphate glycosidase
VSDFVQVSAEVAEALGHGRPVVALETSIVGQGLPAPHNLEAALGCEAVIREEGAVPATIGVLDGRAVIGMTRSEIERIAAGSEKVSSRDLGPALVHQKAGATTVAATMRVAAMAGIRFMATGGIGGVHRGHPEDVSADLQELATTRVAVFCAGPKIILDIGLTLERLESLGVPVLGFDCDEVPAFYRVSSGHRVSARVADAVDAARVLGASWASGSRGVVVAVPPPAELDGADDLVARAIAGAGDVEGAGVTPRLLAMVAELSGGRSLDLNVQVVTNNARIAARVARAYPEEAPPWTR